MSKKIDWHELEFKMITLPTTIKCFFLSHDEKAGYPENYQPPYCERCGKEYPEDDLNFPLIWENITVFFRDIREFGLFEYLADRDPELRKKFDDIESFWDAKTKFVHKRAVVIGLLCGVSIGASFGISTALILVIMESEGMTLLDVLISIIKG